MSEITEDRKNWTWKLRLAGTLLSILLLIWLLWQQDWGVILASMKELSVWVILAILLLLLVRHAWNTTRWFILVRAQRIPISFLRALQLVFSGLFVSNFLPSMVGGDVVRIAGILQESENRVAAVASVVVDRLVGVIGMLFVLPFSGPLLSLVFTEGLLIGGITDSKPRGWRLRLRTGLNKLVESLKIWLNRPSWLALALLASWIAVFTYLCGLLLLAKEIGIPVNLMDVAGATALTYFITIIPLSINGYGLRELAILAFYTHFGASTEQATLLALITRVLFLLVSLPGALWVGKILPGKVRSKPGLNEGHG
jgi:uncharacterized membrane protein YbhN (UPF0104 family)